MAKQARRQALVLAAHGSHYNSNSGEPARRHTAAIAERGGFDQVIAAFWKEFPSLRDVRYLLDADEVFVVPLFMAEGYFTTRVVPRELGLDGPLTLRDGMRLHYTPAVGTDPRLREVILHQVENVTAAAAPPRGETAVVVVGHGTVQNKQSKLTVLEHVERLRADGFAEVAAAFMDEPPYVADVAGLVDAPNLVVVPLFTADGLHSSEDIPTDLGLQRDGEAWRQPSEVAGRRIFYTASVGEDETLIDVVLDLVEQARAAAEPAPAYPASAPADPASAPTGARPAWAAEFLAWLAEQGGPVTFLQVVVEPHGGRWRLRPAAPTHAAAEPRTAAEFHQLAMFNAAGAYRPLPTAPDLRTDWCSAELDGDALVAALEALYPGALAIRHAERTGALEPVDWAEVSGRQTGWRGLVKRVEDADVRAAIEVQCRERCLRRIVWNLDADTPLGVERHDTIVACPEACSVLTDFVRKIGAFRRGEDPAMDGDPRWAAWRARVGEG